MFRTIVCATDFSSAAARAVDVAASWAEQEKAALELVHVVPPPISAAAIDSAPFDRLHLQVRRDAERELEALVARLRPRVAQITGHVAVGFPHEEIVRRAAAAKDALVVLGTVGMGPMARAVLGSIADRVARAMTTPLLLVPPDGDLRPVPPRVIVAPTDLSPASRACVAWTAELARELGAAVEVVHAFEIPFLVPRESSALSGLEEKLREEARTFHALAADAHIHVAEAAPAHAILDVATQTHADLIVLASSGRGRVASLLLGSVTERVLRTCHVPTLVWRGAH